MNIQSKGDRRGQAAMEFLMTYGWAILAAVIVIGVLWYLLQSGSVVGNDLQISRPFFEKGVNINSTHANINLQNGGENQVNITYVNLTSIPGGNCESNGPFTIDVGQQGVVTIPCAQGTGYKYNTGVYLEYHYQGSTFIQTTTGQLTGQVP